MSMHGKATHCDRAPFIGQKNATRGNAGWSCFVVESWYTVPLELLLEIKSPFLFFLGRWEGVFGAILYFDCQLSDHAAVCNSGEQELVPASRSLGQKRDVSFNLFHRLDASLAWLAAASAPERSAEDPVVKACPR